MRPIIKGVAAPLGRQAQPLALKTFPLPRKAALLLLLRSGHPDHTKRVLIAVDVAVQVQRQLFGVAFVGLDLLAILVPVARPHDIIDHLHPLQLAVQAVAKGTGLVTREHLLGQGDLLGHPQQKLRRPEALWWLGRAAVQDPHHHVAV